MDQYVQLQHKIKEKYKEHYEDRPFIVAIDGLSGAGKTTLVNQLKDSLENIVIIHIDDHIVDKSKRYNTGNDEWFEYYQLQWDTIYLKEKLYEKLYKNVSHITLPFYTKETDTFTQRAIKLSPKSIVIIEGIFLLREEWKTYYDYIVFLNCAREIRYDRVLHRDAYIGNLEDRLIKYQNRYWPAEEYYLKKQKPLDFADYLQN